jgi:hypothetical protein
MSRDGASLAELLTECGRLGIRLLVADDGCLTIDAPQDALTPDLLDRLKAHKAELLTLLHRPLDFDIDDTPDAEPAPIIDAATTTSQICRCGSTTWRDVPIHGGESVRRDCGGCGRFIGFPVWYGNGTGRNDQHMIR